jgi:hypothetical protein
MHDFIYSKKVVMPALVYVYAAIFIKTLKAENRFLVF